MTDMSGYLFGAISQMSSTAARVDTWGGGDGARRSPFATRATASAPAGAPEAAAATAVPSSKPVVSSESAPADPTGQPHGEL